MGMELPLLGKEFNARMRALLVAEKPESWLPAVESMDHFLDELDRLVISNPEVISGRLADSSRAISMLLTLIATGTQYRLEQYKPRDAKTEEIRTKIDQVYIPMTGLLRWKAIGLARRYLQSPVFDPIQEAIAHEVDPLLDTMDTQQDPDRFMPFRVIQINNIYERLYGLRLRTNDGVLVGMPGKVGLLREIYDRKYLRFGTSGVRGRWNEDFTERRSRQVVQAICDYLNDVEVPDFVGRESRAGKRMIVGCDARCNAEMVARWVAETCLANGFNVDLSTRDQPTPAVVFYETEVLPPEDVAGLIICTASHNPPEWQGIKFNPRLGYPAPTNVTDYIAYRVNELQLLDEGGGVSDLEEAHERGRLRGFDPLDKYVAWVKNNGNGNNRIPIDFDRIRCFFADKFVVVDEFHGSGRGYLTRLLGEAGIRHTVIHAERDPDLTGLDYANPEEPFINPLKDKVRLSGAHLGMGMDTDADRYGIVDKGGEYYRPNQILPLLVRYLGRERKLTGRVIATQTGSPLNEVLAGMIPGNEAHKPAKGALPGYVSHPFYHLRIGKAEDRVLKHAFLVPVGIKYIEEIRRMDDAYNTLKVLPDDWRDNILIGGEESSGLTTRGHVTDKDGSWANLLVLDMLAYFGTREVNPLTTITEIWEDTVKLPGMWESFGSARDPLSNVGRTDVDAPLEAKEAFIDYYLDMPLHKKPEDCKVAGMAIKYLGGTRYDIAEMQLRDAKGNDQHYLRVRSSGTEPINRIYVESSDAETGRKLMAEALRRLELLTIDEVHKAYSEWRLVDMLAQTRLTPDLLIAVMETIAKNGWQKADILAKIRKMMLVLENRNRKVAQKWVEVMEG
jgi:phosphoglucomutase